MLNRICLRRISQATDLTKIVAYNFGLPLAHLVLAKQLESFTSLRPRSPLYDAEAKRRHRNFDLIATIGGPIVGTLVHLSQMDRRYYVVQGFGPMPATYWNTWGVVWMALVPISIALGCLVYTSESVSSEIGGGEKRDVRTHQLG